VFLKKAAMGKYDEGKTYGRLTSMKLMPWFGQYLEEKAIEREKQMLKDKQNAAIPMLSDRALEAFKQQNGMSTEQWMMVARLERVAKKMTDDQLRAEYVRQKKNGNEAAMKLVLRVAEERGLTKQQQ
jgi:methylphosphotriester-DNA--protein-cysteine methyltransferase